MGVFQGVVDLTESQYQQLVANGTLTVGDVTLTLNNDTIYATKQEIDLKTLATKSSVSEIDNRVALSESDILTLKEQVQGLLDSIESYKRLVAYNNVNDLITQINNLPNTSFYVGQSVYITQTGVSDLWVIGINETLNEYVYIDDAEFIHNLNTNGYVEIGYYKLAILEGEQIDWTPIIKTTGNYEIEGVKNFVGNLQKNGVSVATEQQLTNFIVLGDW